MNVLTQAELNEWLDALAQQVTLVAPVDVEGKLLYRQVESSAGIAWGFERTDMSPKTWLFPATETILTVEQGEETAIHAAPPPPPTVVFGVRPCDARGALAIDALFLDVDPADGQYERHRDATTLVGLACPQMWETCFCTVVGGAPNSTEGLDLLLTEVEGGYAVQVVSEKGQALAPGMPGSEREVALPQPTLREGLPVLRPSAEWKARFDDLYWGRVADRCLGCRVCTFVCPTCRCFDVRDEVIAREPGKQVFARLRAWDACTISAYRRIAGGHNPRPTQHMRLRNRFYCKFMYYPEDFGPLGCVGCGRCIDACPVGIDILEVIAAVGEPVG
ncbi:MAG: 4Fe-4S dicluster domain-containing protein [Anaerolineae bacterium]|nr:4Fe-4S dicluster domain-containing protein [Anaerolineae bacterium]